MASVLRQLLVKVVTYHLRFGLQAELRQCEGCGLNNSPLRHVPTA